MKKLKLTVARAKSHGGPFEASAWALDVPGLAAWNNPGKVGDRVVQMCWQLMHVPTGMHVSSGYKRDEVVQMAELIGDVCDWTQTPTIDELTEAIRRLRAWTAEHLLESARAA